MNKINNPKAYSFEDATVPLQIPCLELFNRSSSDPKSFFSASSYKHLNLKYIARPKTATTMSM